MKKCRVLDTASGMPDAIVLAPGHQRLAGETRIGTQQDAYLRPALADAGDDPRHLFGAAGAGVDVGRARRPTAIPPPAGV